MTDERMPGFLSFKENRELLSEMSYEQIGRLYMRMYEYSFDGEVTTELDPLRKTVFVVIKRSLDRCSGKYRETAQKLSAAGKKGAARRWGKKTDGEAIKGHELSIAKNGEAIKGQAEAIEKNGLYSKQETRNKKLKTNIDYIVNSFNEICVSLPRVAKLTDTRKHKCEALISKYGEERIVDCFRKVESSEFLSGRSGRWTNCNFDWIIKERNLIKVIEGTYDNRGSSTGSWLDAIQRGVFDE